jgi:hypothetical protein
MRRKKKVLFSDKKGWKKGILHEIDRNRFSPEFDKLENAIMNNFNLIIPLEIPDIVFLNRYHSNLNGQKYLAPTTHVLKIANDKKMFNNFLIESGYHELLPRVNIKLDFPYILKKRFDGWGLNSVIIKDSKSEGILKENLTSPKYFKQEYIEGNHEYTTHILRNRGKILFNATVEFKFKEHLFVKGKYFKPCSENNLGSSPFLDIFEMILNDLDFNGLCCFNYKIQNDKPKIFELNPRYGGSLPRFLKGMMVAYNKALEQNKPQGSGL